MKLKSTTKEGLGIVDEQLNFNVDVVKQLNFNADGVKQLNSNMDVDVSVATIVSINWLFSRGGTTDLIQCLHMNLLLHFLLCFVVILQQSSALTLHQMPGRWTRALEKLNGTSPLASEPEGRWARALRLRHAQSDAGVRGGAPLRFSISQLPADRQDQIRKITVTEKQGST